jgi:transposase InsO family protein
MPITQASSTAARHFFAPAHWFLIAKGESMELRPLRSASARLASYLCRRFPFGMSEGPIDCPLRARPRRRRLPSDVGVRQPAAVATNVLDRSFEAPTPNRKWIADFTYIWTAEGWLYVAVIIDLFSRCVVGWSMSASMTAQLVTDALLMAIWRRGKPHALLHHSDQGSQYTSEQFQRLLVDHGVICSNCLGLRERRFRQLGNQLTHQLKSLYHEYLAQRGYAVTLLPGLLRLATRPNLIGSPPVLKTMGTVEVAALAAIAAVMPVATNTVTGARTNSVASAGRRS